MTKQGTIYLVGTGPGDMGLITVKGLALIQEAEAIVGDLRTQALVLQEARPDVERIDVRCRLSHTKISQKEINQRLVALAQQGKNVVRLWPGDPFIYGRASQEIVAAKAAGIRVEVVPGVSSALAGPAYAGVPLTDWEHAISFAVVTGYESKNPAVRPDWDALAKMETLVILMPLDDLPAIVERLTAAGRDPATPAIAIQQGTTPHQRQATTTLGSLVATVQQQQIEAPALVVLGDMVNLAAELAWFEPQERPLLGKRVLVTRPASQATDFMAALRTLGADPVSFPTIEIQPVENNTALDAAIQKIKAAQQSPAYDWLILTSVNGVAAFWERLKANGVDARILSSLKIAAIGPATAAALAQRSIIPDLVPAEYTAEGVLAAFESHPVVGQRFLLARADIARQTLAEGLAAGGGLIEEIPAYRTIPKADGPPPPAADIVTFTSPSTVQGYVNCLAGADPATVLQHSQVVCIGPITAQKAKALGVPVTAIAERYTVEGILEILQQEVDVSSQ